MRAGLGNAGLAPAVQPSRAAANTAWSIVGGVLAVALLLFVAA